jgi:two-component system response regulator
MHACFNHLHVVVDGAEAMAFLRRTGIHTGAPRSDLALLDLNLPHRTDAKCLKR